METSNWDQKQPGRTSLWIKRGLAIATPVLLLGGAFVGSGVLQSIGPTPKETEETVEALPVVTATVERRDRQLTVVSQGEVTARSEAILGAEVSGRIAYVSPNALPGASFRKGELLYRVDPKSYELRVVQAKANVAQARTSLLREQSEAETAQADARDLGLEGVSDLALRRPQVAEAESRLASAEAALDEAELALSRTEVRAPFTGRVQERLADLGSFVSPGAQLLRIYSTDVVEVPLPLTDGDLEALNLNIGFRATGETSGPEVKLSALVAGREREWTAELVRTDGGFDNQTRVLFAYAELEDPYGSGSDDGIPLAPGLFVTAEVEGQDLGDVLVIPRTALRGADRVFVLEGDDTLRIRDVEVASSNRQEALLTSGLEVGDIVITSPVRGAADGMTVAPIDPDFDEDAALASTDQTAQLKD